MRFNRVIASSNELKSRGLKLTEYFYLRTIANEENTKSLSHVQISDSVKLIRNLSQIITPSKTPIGKIGVNLTRIDGGYWDRSLLIAQILGLSAGEKIGGTSADLFLSTGALLSFEDLFRLANVLYCLLLSQTTFQLFCEKYPGSYLSVDSDYLTISGKNEWTNAIDEAISQDSADLSMKTPDWVYEGLSYYQEHSFGLT